MADPVAGFDDRLYQFGPFMVDPVAGDLYRDGTSVPLSPKTFEALVVLLEHRGGVVEKSTLLELIWPDAVVEENTLARHISTLRKALDDDPKHHYYIRTVSGRGYRFAASVRQVTRAELAATPGVVSEPAPDSSTSDAIREVPQSGARRAYIRLLIGAAAALSIVGAASVFVASPEVPPGSAERKLWQFAASGGLDSDPTWDPTGQSIAYVSDRDGNLDIWVQPTRDSHGIRLTSSASHDWQPSWSPDGESIVFRSERDGGGLFIMPAAGGSARRLTDFGYRPQFSPQQSAIAFLGSNVVPSTLYIVQTDGQPPRRVLAEFLAGFAPVRVAWHPDGARLSVFGVRKNEGLSFWTASVDGSDVVRSAIAPAIAERLLTDRITLGEFSWAPSGDALYFEGRSDAAVNIFRIRVNPSTLAWQSGPERLTLSTGLDTDISLSPDGRRLVFTAKDETTRLWAFPFDAMQGRLLGHAVPITHGGTTVAYPDITTDGTEVVYRTVRAEKQEVRRRSFVDGADSIVFAADSAVGPRWSQDGRHVAFRQVQSERPGSAPTQNAVVLVSADGGHERLLTAPGPLEVTPFDWSSDGEWILASCEHGPAGKTAVCLLPVSSAPRALDGMRIITSDTDRNLWQATFSPDQRWIAFMAVSPASGTSTVYVVDADGNQRTAISDGTFWDDKPRWSPDGKIIYFLSNRSGFTNVWGRRFDHVAGQPIGEPFQITSLESPTARVGSPISSTELAIAADRLILPVVESSGSVWVLENVDH